MGSHFFPTPFPLKTTSKFWAGENENLTGIRAEITKANNKNNIITGFNNPKLILDRGDH